jgi:hypothetical protein
MDHRPTYGAGKNELEEWLKKKGMTYEEYLAKVAAESKAAEARAVEAEKAAAAAALVAEKKREEAKKMVASAAERWGWDKGGAGAAGGSTLKNKPKSKFVVGPNGKVSKVSKKGGRRSRSSRRTRRSRR